MDLVCPNQQSILSVTFLLAFVTFVFALPGSV